MSTFASCDNATAPLLHVKGFSWSSTAATRDQFINVYCFILQQEIRVGCCSLMWKTAYQQSRRCVVPLAIQLSPRLLVPEPGPDDQRPCYRIRSAGVGSTDFCAFQRCVSS